MDSNIRSMYAIENGMENSGTESRHSKEFISEYEPFGAVPKNEGQPRIIYCRERMNVTEITRS